jgi:hypothetical protein
MSMATVMEDQALVLTGLDLNRVRVTHSEPFLGHLGHLVLPSRYPILVVDDVSWISRSAPPAMAHAPVLTGLFSDLLEAALGAIVVHAVHGLIRFQPIRALRDRNRIDLVAAVTTLLGVLVFDVLAGLMIGVVVSLAGLMSWAARPRIAWLARDPNSDRFIDREGAGAEAVGGISIVRFESELFFANVVSLRDAVLAEFDETRPYAIVIGGPARLRPADEKRSGRDGGRARPGKRRLRQGFGRSRGGVGNVSESSGW